MWRELQNERRSPLSEMSLGRSNESIRTYTITSHYQSAWFIIFIEWEYTATHLNGSQFRQVYSVTHITINHSQTLHKNSSGMHHYPFEWKSIQASLFNHSYHNQSLSNTTREQPMNAPSPNTSDLSEGKSIQSLTSQSITLKHNTRTHNECTFTKHKWFERRHV